MNVSKALWPEVLSIKYIGRDDATKPRGIVATDLSRLFYSPEALQEKDSILSEGASKRMLL